MVSVSGSGHLILPYKRARLPLWRPCIIAPPPSVVDTNATNKPVLFYAVLSRCEAPIDWLLRHGVSIHATDNRGNTALHYAAEVQAIEVVERLLDAGADLKQTNSQGQTPYEVAKALERPESIRCFEALERGAVVESSLCHGSSSLSAPTL